MEYNITANQVLLVGSYTHQLDVNDDSFFHRFGGIRGSDQQLFIFIRKTVSIPLFKG